MFTDTRGAGTRTRERVAPPRLTRDRLADAARTLLVQGGAEAVVVREVARSLSVVPSALYKHVDGRGGLLTLLIVRLYDEVTASCGAAVAAQAPDAHRARIGAAIGALRGWAARHPAEFDLLFGYPVAGYQAPQDGPTGGAAERLGTVFVEVLAAAAADGRLRPGLAEALPDEVRAALGRGAASVAAGLPPALFYAVIGGWQRILGLVGVEVGGQLSWAGDGAAALTTHQLAVLVDEVLTPGP